MEVISLSLAKLIPSSLEILEFLSLLLTFSEFSGILLLVADVSDVPDRSTFFIGEAEDEALSLSEALEFRSFILTFSEFLGILLLKALSIRLKVSLLGLSEGDAFIFCFH